MRPDVRSRVAGGRPARYTAVAICLHWLIALGILALIAMGLAMTQLDLGPMATFKLYQLHKSVGITVLLAVVIRLLWRLTHRPPPLPDGMPKMEKAAAEGTHRVLYLLMFGLPLTGWALVSASPFNIPTVLYGIVPWPHLAFLAGLKDKAPVEAAFKLVHTYGAWFLIALLALHAAAALRHHVLLRDDVLWRMAPFLKKPAGHDYGTKDNPP